MFQRGFGTARRLRDHGLPEPGLHADQCPRQGTPVTGTHDGTGTGIRLYLSCPCQCMLSVGRVSGDGGQRTESHRNRNRKCHGTLSAG